jgi:hypothetical protein
MRKESAFALFLLSLLLFMTIGEISAQTPTTPTPGVAPGNVFVYDFFAFWNSTDQNAAPPADLLELNKTESIRLTITQVNGLMVLMNITSRFENGTENTQEGMVNILSGSSIRAFGLIVSPKLVTNNVVYPYGDFNFTINGTAIRSYSFGEREAANYNENSTGESDYVYAYQDIYFDRQTGVMLEWYTERVTSSKPNETAALLWKIKEFDLSTIFNIWDYLPVIVAVVAVVVVLTVVVVYRRKRKAKKRHRK